MKKEKHHTNDLHHWKAMTEIICMPCFEESTYFDFGARLFSTQWPLYGSHILQGLILRNIFFLNVCFIQGLLNVCLDWFHNLRFKIEDFYSISTNSTKTTQSLETNWAECCC